MGLVSMSLGLLVFQVSLIVLSLGVSGDLGVGKVLPPIASPRPKPSPKLPIRRLVAVEGVVYCKSCKYAGIPTLTDAKPLAGAVVKLVCNNTKKPSIVEGKTDKNGYYFLQPPKKVTTYGAHKCKTFLVSSPSTTCKKPTDLNKGISGANLKSQKPSTAADLFALFGVAPFAFEPAAKCHN